MTIPTRHLDSWPFAPFEHTGDTFSTKNPGLSAVIAAGPVPQGVAAATAISGFRVVGGRYPVCGCRWSIESPPSPTPPPSRPAAVSCANPHPGPGSAPLGQSPSVLQIRTLVHWLRRPRRPPSVVRIPSLGHGSVARPGRPSHRRSVTSVRFCLLSAPLLLALPRLCSRCTPLLHIQS